MSASPKLLSLLTLLALLAPRATVHAQPVAGLALDVPEECRADSVALSERELPARLPLSHVQLVVEQAGAQYRGTVHTPVGTRTLEGESCLSVVSAGLVFVALTVAQQPAQQPPVDAAAPVQHAALGLTSPRQRSDRREPHEAPVLESRPRARAPLALEAGALTVWGVGALPGSGFGGSLRAGLRRGMWQGLAGLSGLFEREVSAPVAGTGGRFWLWSGLAAVCLARPQGRLRPSACAGVDVGRMHGEGTGVRRSEHARALFAAAFAEAQLRLHLHQGLQVFVSAQPHLALVRRRFRLHGAGVVHQPAQLAFTAALGVAYEFSLTR